MKVAYLILAHNTPKHLSRLVKALNSPNATFIIHIDAKTEISVFRETLAGQTVTFVENRNAVHWGDFSDVRATLKLISEALKAASDSDYLCLLSGSDYPLKSATYIEDFFSNQNGNQFINLVQMPCEALQKPLKRLECYWLETPFKSTLATRVIARLNRLNTEWRLINRDYRKTLADLVPYAGSQWWALTNEACRYIVEFTESRADVVKFFRNVYMPDEAFFQTIIGNSPFAAQVTRNLTFADWSRPEGGPAIIDLQHLRSFLRTPNLIADDLYGRGELLFARKFPDDSAQLTDFIDRHLHMDTARSHSSALGSKRVQPS